MAGFEATTFIAAFACGVKSVSKIREITKRNFTLIPGTDPEPLSWPS